MALLTVLTRESSVHGAVLQALEQDHEVAKTRSWARLLWLVRERPVTTVVLDCAAFPAGSEPDETLADLRRRYPSLATVFIHRPQLDPLTLFRLGRAGLDGLALIRLDGMQAALRGALEATAPKSTEAYVTRSLAGRLPMRETQVVRAALNGVQVGWRGADDFAGRVGFSRAHLSVLLAAQGLPSAGHLLLWAKLLHGGRWLSDPGRSAESVSRQLEYSSGAAFRRALHNYVGSTPTQVRDGGGLIVVLRHFLDACGIGGTLRSERSVA